MRNSKVTASGIFYQNFRFHMKKLLFLNFVLALTLLFQFCSKDENAIDAGLSPQANPQEQSADRSNCTCNLQVIANMAGSSTTSPWLFELSYKGSDGNTHIKQVTANGTSNSSLTIQDGTTQGWYFYGGGNGSSVVNVSARLSCGGDGSKIGGPIRYYVVPANTPAWPASGAIYVANNSTNAACDVE